MSFFFIRTFISKQDSDCLKSLISPLAGQHLTLTTTSRASILLVLCLKTSRIARFTRFLSTALAMIRLLATIPNRFETTAFDSTYNANHLFVIALVRNTRPYSSCRCRRCERGKACVTLCGQANAAFCSTCSDNCSPAFGLHAYQKTVCTLSFCYRWLICSFHNTIPYMFALKSARLQYVR